MAYPEDSYPGLCDVLNTLPVAYRACIRYLPQDRATASEAIGTYRHSHHGQRKDLRTQLKEKTGKQTEDSLLQYAATDYEREAAEFQSEVDRGRVSAGHLTTTVVVWDTTLEGSQAKGEQVVEALNTAGCMAQLEDAHPWMKLNTLEAWLGTLPGERIANVRQPLMHSMNLAHLMPATAPWRGPEWNRHLQGPPLLHAVGKGQTPLRISLHRGDVAHTGVIGSTGDGKSTWLNFACASFTQYAAGQARVRIFDKRRAAWALTHLMGGVWYDLGLMPLQPLAELDRPGEIAWVIDWLDGVLTTERLRVTPTLKTELFQALHELATWDRAKRTMTALASLLERRALKEAVTLFTHQGPYGQIFDGAGVTLTGHPWQCFEMETILEAPTLLNAQLPVLCHQLENVMCGVPELWVFHEGWTAFDTPYWATRLRAQLKGFRVRNATLIIATQSMADAVNSPIMPALLDNVANWIVTPNPQALEDDIGKYYQAVGLNRRQRELLTLATKKRDYYLVQQEGQMLFDLQLGPLALAACRTPEEGEFAAIAAHLAQDPAGFAAWYLGRTV
jgi:type IV secretion system protein VirB4